MNDPIQFFQGVQKIKRIEKAVAQARARNRDPERKVISKDDMVNLKIAIGVSKYDEDYMGKHSDSYVRKFIGQKERYDSRKFLESIGADFYVPPIDDMLDGYTIDEGLTN